MSWKLTHAVSSREPRQVQDEQGYSGLVPQYGRFSMLSDHPVSLLAMWATLAGSVLFSGAHLCGGNGVLPSFCGSVSGNRISCLEKYAFPLKLIFLFHSACLRHLFWLLCRNDFISGAVCCSLVKSVWFCILCVCVRARISSSVNRHSLLKRIKWLGQIRGLIHFCD